MYSIFKDLTKQDILVVVITATAFAYFFIFNNITLYGVKTKQDFINPTPTTTPINYGKGYYEQINKPEPTINQDPIIECQNPNCGSINIKQSLCSDTVGYVCCQVGTTWSWYASRTKCTEDQNKLVEDQKKPYVPYPTLRPYATLIPFPTFAPYPTFEPFATSVPLPTYAPITPQNTYTKEMCQSDVNNKWASTMRSYGCSYPCPNTGACGDSSVCDGLWYQAQRDMNKCNSY